MDPGTGMLRDLEVRILRAGDGAERTIRMKGRALKNADGVFVRAIGTIADITEQRRYERELAAATIVAERANQAKSDFLAGMSHELRTPLNAIIGFSDFIRQCTLGPISPARYREYVDDIHASGTHLLNLINDVLDMAKIEAGKVELSPEPLRLAAIAGEAMRFVEPQASAAGITLAMQVAGNFVLRADRRGLVQVLTNLLSNGVKFTGRGGHVTVFAERTADGGIAVGVEDTGIGMTVEQIQTAIQPFGQVDRMVTVEGHGTGLGLPLVEALLKAHGARFRIESTVGLGTRVWGEVPASSVVMERAVA
jgi:signal transduction histidine kinase